MERTMVGLKSVKNYQVVQRNCLAYLLHLTLQETEAGCAEVVCSLNKYSCEVKAKHSVEQRA